MSLLYRNMGLIRQKSQQYLQTGKKWLRNRPDKALSQAYEAACRIKNIETEQFNGQKITLNSAKYTENVMAYWQVSLNRDLMIIQLKLAEFHFYSFLLNKSKSVFVEKLNLIDEVRAKYSLENEDNHNEIISVSESSLQTNHDKVNHQSDSSHIENMKVNPVFNKTGAFPRSIGRMFNRITADFSPQAEEQFLKNFQISRKRTRTAVRFLAMLVIVPILTQYLSKQLLVLPVVKRLRGENLSQVFLNHEMEEEAISELKTFEEKLKFESLIRQAPLLTSEVREQKVKQEVHTIAKEFREKSNNAISNVFADILSLIGFAWVIATSKREVIIVKSFIDDVIYGLSDSAKAFLIILFTDIFVGFHSPHGWEVILEGFAEHMGLPANRSTIFLFIATFPVILNTIVKYWIFRYLSRLSPSALATLKEMDE
ncbi:proton extrusion protein PcxA [Brasilonema sp. UFV-L1]